MKRLLLATVVAVLTTYGMKAGDIINTHFNTGEVWNYVSFGECESKGDRAVTDETTFTFEGFSYTTNVAIRIYSGSYEQVLRVHDLHVQNAGAGFDVLGRAVTEPKGLVIAKTIYEDGTTSTKKVYRLEK
jgi:hypothetical protein